MWPIGNIIIRNRTPENNMYFQLPPEASKLQSTLSSSTSGVGTLNDFEGPHHPISCHEGTLEYSDGNVLSCRHSKTDPDDPRTKACITHTICLLLFEIVHENLETIKVEPWWT